MTDAALPVVARPAFFDGERLLDDTLDEAFAGPVALHRLHNRALHGWGIGFGLDTAAPRGATTVRVGAGYAIDCAGRDLVLPEPLEVPVPPVSAAPDCSPVPFVLAISYTDDDLATVESREGVCGARGAVRRSDMPTVRFLPPEALRTGLDVLLARVKVRNCVLDEGGRVDERRAALPAGRPHIAAGATRAGFTSWRVWPASGTPMGVATTVPTAAAGFGTTPRYEARVEGPRLVAAASSPTGKVFAVDGLVSIEAATAGSFDAVVLLPSGFAANAAQAVPLNPPEALAQGFLTELGWRVVWHGVEG
jgi:hypothetical protein